jgi:hypothetical protein
VRITSRIGSGANIETPAGGGASVVTYRYDRSLGDTGTIVELDRPGSRSRQARMATVELDPPNTGRMPLEARDLELIPAKEAGG